MKRRNENAQGPRAKRHKSGRPSVADIARMEIAKYNKKKSEVKTYQTNASGTSITTSGVVINLSSGIAQGAAYNQRIGDTITLKALSIRHYISANSTAGSSYVVRILVLRWLGTGDPTVAQVLDTSPGTGADRPNCQLNLNSKKLISVLYDDIITVANQTNDNLPYLVAKKKYIKLGGQATWDAGTTDASNGHVYMICISNNLSTPPQINQTARLKYLDQ